MQKTKQSSRAIKATFLGIIFLVATCFVTDEAFPYFLNFNIEQYRDYYWSSRWWLIGHLLGGGIALLLGPFQFSTTFRNRYISLHRNLGKVFIIAIIIGSLCAVYMSFFVAPRVNISWSISLFVMALAWFVSVLMAYRMIRLRRVPQHKEWMIRAYIITLAFVLFRILNKSSFVRDLMPTFEERGPACIWVAWVIPLFIAEVILQWKKKR
ncbi:MAG: DUF2306 domain-containing protein [Winogradskyella sp.]|uniref:DUF2306 domain-containing protein n=1 Tax=Winogradskyella sp. TaxID=1883156 RepID=UPI00385F6F7B